MRCVSSVKFHEITIGGVGGVEVDVLECVVMKCLWRGCFDDDVV